MRRCCRSASPMSQHKGPSSTAPSSLSLTHPQPFRLVPTSSLLRRALDRSLPASSNSKHHVQSAEQQEQWHTSRSQKSTYSVFVDGDESVDSAAGFVRRRAPTEGLTARVAERRQDTGSSRVAWIDNVATPCSNISIEDICSNFQRMWSYSTDYHRYRHTCSFETYTKQYKAHHRWGSGG